MPVQRRALVISAFAAVLGGASTAVADTDGYMTTGWGVRAKGMAGMSIAFASDSLTVANNPAGMIRLGKRFDGSLSLFSPDRYYSVEGAPTGPGSFLPGKVTSGDKWFLIPDLGYIQPLKDGSAIGLALFANGGMNTNWPSSANGGAGTFGDGSTGVNLEQAFVAASYAKRLDERNTVGLAVLLARQKFSAKGLQNFAPGSNTISDNGDDISTGIGFRLGWQSDLGHGWRLGAIYQPKINMSRFDKYESLFAGQGDFDIPSIFGAGLSFDFSGKETLGFEVKKINYTDVASVSNPIENMGNGLGSDDGPGFGWRDMTVWKLGYENRLREDLTLRCGVSYGRQPIPGSQMNFNILAPGVVEWHFSAGFTKAMNKRSEFSMAFTFSPRKTIHGRNANDPTQTIRLSMQELEIVAGYSYKF